MAILLRTGTKGKSVLEIAYNLIKSEKNLANLALKSINELTEHEGIGKDKAATLMAAFEITKRIKFNEKWYSNKQIKSPTDIAEIFLPVFRDELKEKFTVVCLNSANKIISYKVITEGTLTCSLVHPREVFKYAIINNSANIILMHNHPSGNNKPSQEDIKITKQIRDAGKLIDIKVFDHIILAGDKYTSFVEKGLI